LIVVAVLAATGFMPFLDATATAAGSVKVYFLCFAIAVGTMLATWSARVLAGRPSWPVRPNQLIGVLLVYLVYVVLALGATQPLAEPTVAAPFIEFPVMAIATYLWLSHQDAMDGLKRLIPFIVLVVAVWAIAFAIGTPGCGGCRSYVSSNLSHDGLFGNNSRLYAPGQYTLLALVLVAFGQALRRPSPLTVSLTVLGMTCVAFQYFRIQYLGILTGMLVLIVWRLREARAGARLLAIGAGAVVLVTLIVSPIGSRASSAYDELSSRTGTGGYRIALIEDISDHWTVLGTGVTSETISLGFNQDIGMSNTLLVLGFAGGAIQLVVLGAGFVAGIRARSLAGATLAAIFAMVIVTRPSLALMELGHSPIAYGAAVGIAAWLYRVVPARKPQPARPRRMAERGRSRRRLAPAGGPARTSLP
jgi:hypothetical protein